MFPQTLKKKVSIMEFQLDNKNGNAMPCNMNYQSSIAGDTEFIVTKSSK